MKARKIKRSYYAAKPILRDEDFYISFALSALPLTAVVATSVRSILGDAFDPAAYGAGVGVLPIVAYLHGRLRLRGDAVQAHAVAAAADPGDRAVA